MSDGEDETGVHTRVQNAKRSPCWRAAAAADAGRGRAWDPALDAEAVARHAERALTQAAVCWIDGRLATKLSCVPSDQAAEIARPLRGVRPHAAWSATY